MPVERVDFVGIRTGRLKETVSLFRDVLSVPVVRQTEGLVGFRLADGTVIELYGPSEEFHAFFTTGPVVGFRVDDFPAVRRMMIDAGVQFLGEVQSAEGHFWQHFRAPDGAILEISGPVLGTLAEPGTDQARAAMSAAVQSLAQQVSRDGYSFDIRRATADDVDAVAALNDHVQKPHSSFEPAIFRSTTDAAELRAFFSQAIGKASNFVFLAFSEATPIGYAWFEIQDRPQNPFEHAGRLAHVHHIAVDAGVRRNGVASKLFSIVEQEARSHGVSQIGLEVWAKNNIAQEFFRTRGFLPQRVSLAKNLDE